MNSIKEKLNKMAYWLSYVCLSFFIIWLIFPADLLAYIALFLGLLTFIMGVIGIPAGIDKIPKPQVYRSVWGIFISFIVSLAFAIAIIWPVIFPFGIQAN